MIDKFRKYTLLLLASFVIHHAAYSEELNLRFGTYNICKMVPQHWTCTPGIEPAIPKDYVVHLENNMAYWGTQKDLEKFKGNIEGPLESPIFHVFQNGVLAQTGDNSFTNFKRLLQAYKPFGIKKQTITEGQWGIYPLRILRGTKNGAPHRSVWVGLFEQNCVLEIMMINSNDPAKDQKIWNNFIKNTECLPDQDRYIVKGLDHYNGYTYQNICGSLVKVTVEKRFSDDMLAVLIEPLTENTLFEFKALKLGLMASDWKFAEMSVKVIGTVTEVKDNVVNYINSFINVIPKSVDEFSFSTDPNDHDTNVVVFETPKERKYFD
ncbi:MAG: hypothetical protein VX777_07355 [Chlamydiota bacterium]|nr:hypothetical protein [Chlamydiota bacterium]